MDKALWTAVPSLREQSDLLAMLSNAHRTNGGIAQATQMDLVRERIDAQREQLSTLVLHPPAPKQTATVRNLARAMTSLDGDRAPDQGRRAQSDGSSGERVAYMALFRPINSSGHQAFDHLVAVAKSFRHEQRALDVAFVEHVDLAAMDRTAARALNEESEFQFVLKASSEL